MSEQAGLTCCFLLLQVTFVRSHFREIVSGEEKAGLPELPQDVIHSLLSSEELETQSEDDILEVCNSEASLASCHGAAGSIACMIGASV